MSHFFDYLAGLIIIFLAIVGFRRGFLEELSRLIALIFSSLFALKFYIPLTEWLQTKFLLDKSILSLLVYLILFFSILIVTRLIMGSIQIYILSRGIRSSNKLLGILFGSLKGLITVLVILWIVDIAPNQRYFDNFKKHSYLYRHYSDYPKRIAASFGVEDVMIKSETWVKKKLNTTK